MSKFFCKDLSNSTFKNETLKAITSRSPHPVNFRLAQNEDPKSGDSETKPDKSQYNLILAYLLEV